MPKSIEPIIQPQSIAVVGASNRQGSVGYAVFNNIMKAEFQGIVYPVNPNARSVCTVKAYPSLSAIGDQIDLAIIIVPSSQVANVLQEAGEQGIKGAIIISAGFREIGGKGIELEQQILEIANQYNIRMIGPNCLGVVNNNSSIQLNASFAQKTPKPGRLAFISQSGALCTSVLEYADSRNIGFSKFISFGNKADVNEIDLLRYLKDDPDTDVILMYLEDISHGREFLEVAREITWKAKKPILAIKSGSSEEGARAAASHTGSLAGSDKAYDAIFLQSGIQRVEEVSELFNHAVAFAMQPIPKSNRIAIVTNAGGPGIMATDAAIRHNLQIAKLSDDTKEKLKKVLPPTASLNNPVDIIGDADSKRYDAAIQHVIADENVDGLIIILSPQAISKPLDIAKIVPSAVKGITKPVLSSFMGLLDNADGGHYLEKNGFPNFAFPESAVRSMAAMIRFGDSMSLLNREYQSFKVNQDAVSQKIKTYLSNKQSHYLPQKEANEILKEYGFSILNSVLVNDVSLLDKAIETIGFPVAMKISSPDIVHKFEAGGVFLKIKTKKEAQNTFHKIIDNAKKYKANARIQGVLVEKMAKSGIEVILGATRDPKFGPICMFGLGGTFVESIKDVTFRIAPMWISSAERMIKTIKLYSVLKGVRGAPPSDIQAIKECILRLSQLVSTHPEISEMDINPLIVYPEGQGCVVADSRILLKKLS